MKYALGIDFGTQSCRGLLVGVDTGNEVVSCTESYPHGVMDSFMPDKKTKLAADFALQHPEDYLVVLEKVCKGVIEKANIMPEEIIGVGVDFTACTILPIDKNDNPLSNQSIFKNNPHAYVKLWKHHHAQPYADQINELAISKGENFLNHYGGKISSEWLLPKVMEILNEAPEIYEAADRFIEAGDWIVLKLTGKERRSSCMAGYKGLWHKKDGHVSKEFLKTLDSRLENLVEDKLSDNIYPLGDKAGEISRAGAKLTGLAEGTAVAIAVIDAHSAVPAAGVAGEGDMLLIMGTSTCHLTLSKVEQQVPGISGIVEDGILPGLIGYEAGQACVGDHFEWFVNNCVPEDYIEASRLEGVDIHTYLTKKSEALKVGESGLLALDWWNGNRSVLVDADLAGLMIGYTLTTKPEEIYRALIEATAFGTKKIIDTFKEQGVPIKMLYAAGGIAMKNTMMMQIYSDVLGLPIKICDSNEAVALGSAIFGAVVAGEEKGGYANIYDAIKKMSKVREGGYEPIETNTEQYQLLYNEYLLLHDYFGKDGNNVMKRLKKIKRDIVG